MLLLTWDNRRHSEDAETLARADRWLVAAAGIYGVAVANHSLALLLPPAIGLFVLAADWRVVLQVAHDRDLRPAVLVGTIVILFARAADPGGHGRPPRLRAPRHVSAASSTWSWPSSSGAASTNPFGDLPTKAGLVMDLLTGWLGPIGVLAASGWPRACSVGPGTCS